MFEKLSGDSQKGRKTIKKKLCGFLFERFSAFWGVGVEFLESFKKVFGRLWKSCQNKFFNGFGQILDLPDLVGNALYGTATRILA